MTTANINQSPNRLNAPVTMPRLISINEVIKHTGLSRASIYCMLDETSKSYDATFPKKVQLSEVRVAWVASEIAEWINSKIASR